MLPVEPKSLVEQYLEGKERPSKEQVVASRKSRFSKTALPAITERDNQLGNRVLVKENVPPKMQL